MMAFFSYGENKRSFTCLETLIRSYLNQWDKTGYFKKWAIDEDTIKYAGLIVVKRDGGKNPAFVIIKNSANALLSSKQKQTLFKHLSKHPLYEVNNCGKDINDYIQTIKDNETEIKGLERLMTKKAKKILVKPHPDSFQTIENYQMRKDYLVNQNEWLENRVQEIKEEMFDKAITQ